MVGSTSHTTLLAYVFRSLSPAFCSRKMVGSSGLEPPTSRLSGVRSNHLSYEPISLSLKISGGDERDRTDDPLLAKQVLSQLSYTPVSDHTSLKFRLFLFQGSHEPSKLNNELLKSFLQTSLSADLEVQRILFFVFSIERR